MEKNDFTPRLAHLVAGGLLCLAASGAAWAEDNTAATSQNGGSNSATTAQRGRSNSAMTDQSGAFNRASIQQAGRGNAAGIAQSGVGFDAQIQQTGNWLSESVFQMNTQGQSSRTGGHSLSGTQSSATVRYDTQ